MTILPPSTDHTSKDFESLRLRLRALIKSVFPTWTSPAIANVGNILVELCAWTGDVLTFTQDNQALESRLATVTQRKNLLALCKLIAYRPPGATAATTEETFTGVGLTANVIIPAGTAIRTQSEDSPVRFQVLSQVLLTPGQPTATATIEHSTTFVESFTASGQPNQQITLGQIPYLDGSAEVTDGSGLWTEVPNFLDSGSAEKHYVVSPDNNDRATITFGDGINGKLPTGTIDVVYKTGGGLLGNVEAGSINKIDATLLDMSSNVVTVIATNAAAASGGAEREENAVTKIKAPASIRDVKTTMSKADFEARAVEVAGVARALMISTSEDPTVERDRGFLRLVPTNLGFPSAVMKQKVFDRVTKTYPCHMTFELVPGKWPAGTSGPPEGLADTQYLDIAVTAKVAFEKGIDTAAKRSAIKRAITASLRSYFQPLNDDGSPNTRVDFGANLTKADGTPSGQLPLSDLIDAVRDTVDVRKVGPALADFTVSAVRRFPSTPTGDVTVLASGSHADIPMQLADWPRLDGDVDGTPNVVVVDVETGLVVT